MADDWESLSEKENVVLPQKIPANINKWEGEDEDEDVKDSWEDEEEKKDEEKIKEEVITKPAEINKRKNQNKINEKERQKLELQDTLEIEEIENVTPMTPEEKAAEKLRLQKIQEEEDLKTALDTFGITESPNGIDGMHPTNKNEFSELAQALCKKISYYKSHDEFSGFIEELVRSLCANLNVIELKKIKLTVENVYVEKQKMEKEKAKKPSGKGKTKVKLRVEEDNVRSNNIGDYGYDYDYDDFM